MPTFVTNRVVEPNLIGNQITLTSLSSTDEFLVRRPSTNELRKVTTDTITAAAQTSLSQLSAAQTSLLQLSAGFAKAWAAFTWNNGTGILTVHDSYNVQSITVPTRVLYQFCYVINFITPMPNRNYAVVTAVSRQPNYEPTGLYVPTASYPWETTGLDIPSTQASPNTTGNFNSCKTTTQLKLASYYNTSGITTQQVTTLIEGYFAIYAD